MMPAETRRIKGNFKGPSVGAKEILYGNFYSHRLASADLSVL